MCHRATAFTNSLLLFGLEVYSQKSDSFGIIEMVLLLTDTFGQFITKSSHIARGLGRYDVCNFFLVFPERDYFRQSNM